MDVRAYRRVALYLERQGAPHRGAHKELHASRQALARPGGGSTREPEDRPGREAREARSELGACSAPARPPASGCVPGSSAFPVRRPHHSRQPGSSAISGFETLGFVGRIAPAETVALVEDRR